MNYKSLYHKCEQSRQEKLKLIRELKRQLEQMENKHNEDLKAFAEWREVHIYKKEDDVWLLNTPGSYLRLTIDEMIEHYRSEKRQTNTLQQKPTKKL